MDAYFKDSRAGGDGVFVDIDYLYWTQECSECQAGLYQTKGNDQTGRTTSGSWAGPSHQTPHSLWGGEQLGRAGRSKCVRTRRGRVTLAANLTPCRAGC